MKVQAVQSLMGFRENIRENLRKKGETREHIGKKGV
jgi:hypothetical protein